MVDTGSKTINLFPFILPLFLNGGGVVMIHSKSSLDHFTAVYQLPQTGFRRDSLIMLDE